MEFIKKIKNKGLILIILLASLVRLVGLGSVPYGFANDEVSYILSGYEIAQTGGYDIAGKFLPLSVNLDSSLSPVPVYIISAFVKLLGLSAFVARLPFSLMGIGIVIVLYFICKELFKNEGIALASALILALSPWHILVTRSVWDVIPAQFFYLLGFLIYLKTVKKGGFLWSIPFFLLGFFSYHGTKVFFVFFILLIIAVFRKELLKRKKEAVLFFGGLFLIFTLFALVLKTQSVTRQQEIIFTNEAVTKEAKTTIDFNRAKSSAPWKMREFVDNKVTFLMQKITFDYLGAFSTQHLFTIGDIHPLVGYGVFFKGVLYLIDLPFLLIGLIFLIEKAGFFTKTQKETTDNSVDYKKSFIIVMVSLLISPFPSMVVEGFSYLIRSFMMAPFIAIIIGTGLYTTWNLFEKRKILRYLLRMLLVLLYILFISKFFYQYYYQLNTYGSEYWNQSSRELSEYILNNRNKFDHIIVANAEDKVILQHAMVSHADSKEIQNAWKKDWPVKVGNVIFENSCYKDSQLKDKIKPRTLYIVPGSCHPLLSPARVIADPMEPLRIVWKLYEN